MNRAVTAYPYKRMRPSAYLWDELEIVYPENWELDNVSEKWDYDVDLEIKISVEVSETVFASDQYEGLKLAVDVHCASTMWRAYEVFVADDIATTGMRRYSGTIRIPGRNVSGAIEVKQYLVAPVTIPFFKSSISQVILAEGPARTVALESSLFYFPTSILSFTEANWANSPWRFEVTPVTLDDSYVNSCRLYINSDSKISEVLKKSEGDALNNNAVTAITRDFLLTTLMKLNTDNSLRAESVDSDFAAGSVGQVVSKQMNDVFGRSLAAVLNEFEKNPTSVLTELDAGTNYFGRGI